MKTNREMKKRILTIAALVLLLSTRWMFYRLELEPWIITPLFVAAALFFVLIYGLWLFRVPPALTLAAAAAGCAGLCVLHGTYGAQQTPDLLQPVAFLPPFLFLIEQATAPKTGKTVSTFASFMEYACVAVLLVLAGFALTKNTPSFTSELAFALFLPITVAAVFALIMRTPIKKQNKKIKEAGNLPSRRRIRSSFVRAIAAILCGGVFFAVKESYSSAYTLSILWITDLLLLFDAEHPSVISFADRICKKTIYFLHDDTSV